MSKYHYVRKSITWDGHRYEVRGKTEMEAVERLSELLTSLQEGRVLRSGDTLVDIWYQEWKRVYKASRDLNQKKFTAIRMKNIGSILPCDRHATSSGRS